MKIIGQIKSKTTLLLLALTAIVASCNKDTGDVLPTLSQMAVSYKGLGQLELSVIKSDFLVTLSNKNTASGSEGNFTMFAPTNEAFAKIGLANPQDLNLLQHPFLVNLLKYHISNGNTRNEMLANGNTVTSLLGENLKKIFIVRNNELYVNGAKVISANIKTDNGTLHVINRVLLGSDTDIANTAMFFAQGKGFVKPELTFFEEAIAYADLVNTLSNATAGYTVFAPTDQAFKDLGKTLNVAINQPADIRKLDKATVKQILLNHVLETGGKFTSQLYPGSVQALSGKNITLGEYINGVLSVKGAGNTTVANMVIPDIQTTNGVVHVIDSVLLP